MKNLILMIFILLIACLLINGCSSPSGYTSKTNYSSEKLMRELDDKDGTEKDGSKKMVGIHYIFWLSCLMLFVSELISLYYDRRYEF